MTIIVKTLRYFAFVLVLVLCAGTLQYLNFKSDTAFLHLKQFAVKTGLYLPAFYAHIFAASIILIAGFLQFSKRVYTNRSLHRTLGKIYVFGVLFFASPGGFVMTFFIHRGAGVFISFLIQNTLWVIFTISAWVFIKSGKVDQHVQMMRRSYALAFAAVTLRFYLWLFNLSGVGLGFENNYVLFAFLSWVPNLVLAELINYFGEKPIASKSF
ncbi:MAG: DUF2306 domain-containing protein [Mucilaginibacter sp.]